jgi:hypothetical protein
MAARRLILVMLVLLVLSSAVAALIPVDRAERDDTTTETRTTQRPPTPTGELVTARIDANAREAKRIRAHTGDQLELTVSASGPGQVEIIALGVFEGVDRLTPASIDLLLFDPGTFPVRLLAPDAGTGAGRVIGRIVVRGAGSDPS